MKGETPERTPDQVGPEWDKYYEDLAKYNAEYGEQAAPAPDASPAKAPPPAAKGAEEGGNTVEISREELKALAEQAGVRVQIGNTPLSGDAPGPGTPSGAPPPNTFQPLLDALAPLNDLPPVLRYTAFLALTGAASAILLPLFGSGSLGDMTGRPKEPTEQAAKPAEKKEDPKKAPPKAEAPAPKGGGGEGGKAAAPQKEAGGSLFPDLSNLAPPPEELDIKKSCDTWPFSLTPSCTDPDIGSKAVLKNLDQYTGKGKVKAAEEKAAREAAGGAATEEAKPPKKNPFAAKKEEAAKKKAAEASAAASAADEEEE